MLEIRTLKEKDRRVRYLHYPGITERLEAMHPHTNITTWYPDEKHPEKMWCIDRGRMNPFLLFWKSTGWAGLTEEGYFQMKQLLPGGEAARISYEEAEIYEFTERGDQSLLQIVEHASEYWFFPTEYFVRRDLEKKESIRRETLASMQSSRQL